MPASNPPSLFRLSSKKKRAAPQVRLRDRPAVGPTRQRREDLLRRASRRRRFGRAAQQKRDAGCCRKGRLPDCTDHDRDTRKVGHIDPIPDATIFPFIRGFLEPVAGQSDGRMRVASGGDPKIPQTRLYRDRDLEARKSPPLSAW